MCKLLKEYLTARAIHWFSPPPPPPQPSLVCCYTMGFGFLFKSTKSELDHVHENAIFKSTGKASALCPFQKQAWRYFENNLCTCADKCMHQITRQTFFEIIVSSLWGFCQHYSWSDSRYLFHHWGAYVCRQPQQVPVHSASSSTARSQPARYNPRGTGPLHLHPGWHLHPVS